jgi:hypothetical protein
VPVIPAAFIYARAFNRAVTRTVFGRLAALAIATSAPITKAQAYGFGQRYDLPLPLWLYLTGAGIVCIRKINALFPQEA